MYPHVTIEPVDIVLDPKSNHKIIDLFKALSVNNITKAKNINLELYGKRIGLSYYNDLLRLTVLEKDDMFKFTTLFSCHNEYKLYSNMLRDIVLNSISGKIYIEDEYTYFIFDIEECKEHLSKLGDDVFDNIWYYDGDEENLVVQEELDSLAKYIVHEDIFDNEAPSVINDYTNSDYNIIVTDNEEEYNKIKNGE